MKSLFFFAKSLSFSRIYHVLTLFIADSVRIHLVFRALVANLLSIHYQFRELTLHLFSVLRIRCLFRESTKNFLSFSLWVHLFVNSPSNSRTRYLFRESTMNWLSVWPLHHEFTVFFATQLWIDFAFQELSIMIIYNEFTVCLAIALWIHCLRHDSTMNRLCVQGIQYF